ncbi:MAG: hypothetical protein J7K75_08060 [Desulfuromonas sp.]|nr:hypothetical protein [Desulfuromonas sp.]
MLNLNDSEERYIERAQHINLNDIDYHVIMRRRARHTYTLLGLGGSFSMVGLLLFIAEMLPDVQGIGSTPVSLLLITGLFIVFHAMRYQKEMETRVTYEILQRIQAIEGQNGFLWRINTIINAYCHEIYGGLPEGVQQLQTSSQAGGIEMNEIHLYKEVLENVLTWYQQNHT